MNIYDVILELKRINSVLDRKLKSATISKDTDLISNLTLAQINLRNSIRDLGYITEIIDNSLNYDREIL
jgi:hypothetical protein